MKNKKKGLLHIIVILAVIALCSFTTLVGFTKAHKGSARNIKLGLDLAGGVSITYDVVGDKPTDAELKDTVTMMQKRAEVHSTESSVVTDEKGRIVIDIPGVDDAEKVLSDLGKEGSLDFVAQDDMDLSVASRFIQRQFVPVKTSRVQRLERHRKNPPKPNSTLYH